jgi:hypothetical protein
MIDESNPYNNTGGGGGFVAGGSPYGSQGESPGGGKKVNISSSLLLPHP